MKMLSKLLIAASLFASSTFAGDFVPKIDASEVEGVSIYLLPEDGRPNEDGGIDQFWLVELINKGQVPEGVHLVDVREPEKFNAEHLPGAINLPSVKDKIDYSKLPKEGVVVLYCNTGMKSINVRSVMEDEELLERVFTLDATLDCDKDNKNCKLKPNEAI